jgi:hypothetical protein
MLGPVMINGVNYSWCNLNHIAFGVPVTGLLGLDFSRKQVSENTMALGREPVSMAPSCRSQSPTLII